MRLPNRALSLTALSAAAALALTGCATGAESAGPSDAAASGKDRITVVASTSVYGQIAEEIGGDLVDVTSIVSSTSQDPHSFEPSAQDQLAISRADLIIENGGGYDAFVDALIESSGSEAHEVTAAEFSHDWPEGDAHDHGEDEGAVPSEDATPGAEAPTDPATGEATDGAHADGAHADDGHDHGDHGHVEGFNEHVWYDPHTIEHVAEGIAHELGELRPEDADTFESNAATFIDGIAGLEGALGDIAAAHAGEKVFVTEPVPLYLIRAAELENVTPPAFTEAVEEGQDVAPATLLEALDLLGSGDVRVVIANTQTGGAETTEVLSDAETRSIPVLEFSETLPEGQTYLSWMQANIEALAVALDA